MEPESFADGNGEGDVAFDNRYFDPPIVLDRGDPRFAVITDKGRRSMPVIHPKDRPPPKRFVVRDITEGSGPIARPGDRLAVNYVGVDYTTGKVQFETWPPLDTPLAVELGLRGNAWDWEEGLVGMRVGGRREMLIPPTPSGSNALDYIFDLVRLEPAPTLPHDH
jgi:hypothetical protein